MSTAVLDAATGSATSDDLDTLVERIVEGFPRLTEEAKADLGHLLAPSRA